MRRASWNEASGLSGIVYALAQTTDGFLWIGTTTGLYRFDGLKFEPFFELAGDHPILDVHALLATADGGLWIGYRNGIAFLKQVTASFYTEQQGLPYGHVDSLAQTPDGAVRAAVSGGLARLSNGRWERIQSNWNYPALDGSFFAGVSAIFPTDHDGLWLKAPQGVMQIPQDEVAAFLHDHAHAVSYRTFDVATDFAAPLARYATTGTDTARSGDGKLWFAVLGGVAMIDPAHLAMNESPPPVFIHTLTANGRVYSAYHDLVLPKSTREVSLDYTALSLTLSERNRFRYRLVGLDTSWKDAGTRRQAFYTNLAPGTYTF
jgi:ligand-binding sensor domain-containing protein